MLKVKSYRSLLDDVLLRYPAFSEVLGGQGRAGTGTAPGQDKNNAPTIALEAIERAANSLEDAATHRAKTVALLSAGEERIARIQSETRILLEELLQAR